MKYDTTVVGPLVLVRAYKQLSLRVEPTALRESTSLLMRYLVPTM